MAEIGFYHLHRDAARTRPAGLLEQALDARLCASVVLAGSAERVEHSERGAVDL